jgi:hypothetical protein
LFVLSLGTTGYHLQIVIHPAIPIHAAKMLAEDFYFISHLADRIHDPALEADNDNRSHTLNHARD